MLALSDTSNLRARNCAQPSCPEEAPQNGTPCPKKQQGEWCAWNYHLIPVPSDGICSEPLRCVPAKQCLCDTDVVQGKGGSKTAWTCPEVYPVFCDESQLPLSFQACTTECPPKRPEDGEPCTFWPKPEESGENGDELVGVNCMYDYFKFYDTTTGECKTPFLCNPTTQCRCDYSSGVRGVWECEYLLHGGICDDETFKMVQTDRPCKPPKGSNNKGNNN